MLMISTTLVFIQRFAKFVVFLIKYLKEEVFQTFHQFYDFAVGSRIIELLCNCDSISFAFLYARIGRSNSIDQLARMIHLIKHNSRHSAILEKFVQGTLICQRTQQRVIL